MSIEFHKVTWYSKALALALFVLLPFIGFYLGYEYRSLEEYVAANQPSSGDALSGQLPEYYGNTAEWQAYHRTDAGFTLSYPIDFETNDIHSSGPTPEWSQAGDGTPGKLFFALTVPKAFEPQTNFSDARLTVGESADKAAVQDCMSAPANNLPITYGTTTIGGTDFAKYVMNDAGAGNLYQTTSYRTLHGGQCWAVEYTIHSAQIANYPAEYHLRPFDTEKLQDLLDRIAGTFRFE